MRKMQTFWMAGPWAQLPKKPAILAILAGGIVFCAYLATLAPSVFVRDSAELTTAAYTLGLVHAPGYPVYLMAAHWFLYLPIGDIGYRANLFSAASNAGTVALLALLVSKICGRSFPALIAALSFGFCYYAWSVSVIAEVYTFQGLLLAILLLSVWLWREKGQRHYLLFAIGIAGLALANNPATLLWWPGLIFLAWATPHRRKLDVRVGLLGMGVFLLSLTPIVYLPWRSIVSPEFAYAGQYDAEGLFHPLDLSRSANLIWYLSGRPFRLLMLAYTPAELVVEAMRFLHWLLAAFLGVGLPIGLWGVWRLWRHNRAVATGLALTILPHAIFFIAYRALDKDTMFLPVFLVWAVLLGVGIHELQQSLPGRVAAVGLLLPIGLFGLNWSYVDVNGMWQPHDLAEARLRHAAPNSVYLAMWGDAAAMQYHQAVSGLRPDVTVVNIFFIRSDKLRTLVETTLVGHRSVYSTVVEPGLVNHYRFVSIDDGYKILRQRRQP